MLQELEAFGLENDARVTQRSQKMLNITPETGPFLTVLIRAMQARRVLELGTSNGYSTLWLAHAVQPLQGRVTTIESSAHKVEMAQANFQRAGLEALIDLRLTNAEQWLAQQPGASFDFIFLDADRDQYVRWWPVLQFILSPGGLIVVDNAVSHANEIKAFAELVERTPGYLSSLAPVGNGELLIFKELDWRFFGV